MTLAEINRNTTSKERVFSRQTLLYKRQQFDNNENEKKTREYPTKRQQINCSEDQERENPANYDNDRYVPLFPKPKLIDRPLNLGVRTKSVTHFVSIEFNKYYNSWRSSNKASESSQTERIRKQKNTTIAKEPSHLREGFEDLLAMLKSQVTFSALSIDCCHHLRDGLEIRSEFTLTSTFFANGPNIPYITSATTETLETCFALWCGHCRRSEIKDSTLAVHSLSKYI